MGVWPRVQGVQFDVLCLELLKRGSRDGLQDGLMMLFDDSCGDDVSGWAVFVAYFEGVDDLAE